MKRPRGDKNRYPTHGFMKGPLKKGRLPVLEIVTKVLRRKKKIVSGAGISVSPEPNSMVLTKDGEIK